jgi:ribosome maturation factor RimP
MAALQYRLHDQLGGFSPPIFFGRLFLTGLDFRSMALQDTIAQTVTGLGYDLVDIERTAGGLLRITIELPHTPGAAEQFINAEDCEKVTRQLQFVLEVEGVDYSRLEVSSPGIDRPLKTEKDFERFAGELVDVTLKQPIGVAASAGSPVSANRKKFRGTLEKSAVAGWQIVWRDEPVVKPGQKISKNREPAPLQSLGFTLDEIHQARLAPVVDFNGRRPKITPVEPSADGTAN